MGQDLSNFTQQKRERNRRRFSCLVVALYSLAKILWERLMREVREFEINFEMKKKFHK
jgi:hypothetical protein